MAKNKEKCPCCGSYVNEDNKKCPKCNRAFGMGWYKFIIWVQMFGYMVYFAWLGVSYLRGTIYGGSEGVANSIAMYKDYPLLKIVDSMQGLILLVFAVGAFFVRKWLAERKSGSPKMYLIYLIITALEPVVYSIVATIVSNANTMGSTLSSMYSSIILVFVSLIYFKNRSKYFTE